MLSFAQLEKHYRLLEIIEQYSRLLSRYETGLRAVHLDGMPYSKNNQVDKLGELMVLKEQAVEKLKRLQALSDAEAPQVEETIKAAAGHGRDSVKTELILRARYQSGKDWPEIADMLHAPKIELIKKLVIQRLSKLEGQ